LLTLSGLSEKSAKSLPPSADNSNRNYAKEVANFASGSDDSFADIDLSLVLDRYFGLRAGYFERWLNGYTD